MASLNIVGPRVKEARRFRNSPLTQEELASKLQILGWDIDRFGVSKIERGQRQVTDKEILMLAKALGISVIRLLGED
jgi:transcriptional regulator with XRE-family HTH domain